MNIRLLLLFLLLASPFASADQIVLSDGSKVQGKVISLNNGQYTIQTATLGTITVPQSKVRSISSGVGSQSQNDIAKQATDTMSQSAMQSIQSNIAGDPGMMSTIMSLQNDPDMQAVLNDPEVMQAVRNMDFDALANHPKIKKLMSNSKVKSIQGKVN